MKIAGITRFKNGELFMLLKKLNWSQSELARRCGLSPSKVGDYCNLKAKPSEEIANRIQNAFGEAGEYLDVLLCWPPEFKPLKKSLVVEQVKEVELDAIAYRVHLELLEDDNRFRREEAEQFVQAMEVLNDRERAVIENRCGYNGELGKTLKETGKVINATQERVRQIERKALRKIRHQISLACSDEPQDLFTAEVRAKVRPITLKYENERNQFIERQSIKGKQRWEKIRTKRKSKPERRTVYYPPPKSYTFNPNPKPTATPIRDYTILETKYGFQRLPYRNVVKYLVRPMRVIKQVVTALDRNGYSRTEPGVYVKCEHDEVTIRTCNHTQDPSLFFIVVSRR